MDKIDQVLAKALDAAIVRQGGKNAVISRRLREKSYKFTPQGIGHYRRGKRAIPFKFIQGWREVFQEDLEKLAKNVSYETNPKQKTMDMDVWEVIKGSNKIFELEFDRLWGLIERFGPPPPPSTLKKEPIVKNGS
jgi:hypothetical protein